MKPVVVFASQHPRWWSAIKGVIVTIPAAVIAYAAVKWTTSPLPGQTPLRTFLEAHVYLTVGFLVCPLLLPHLFAIVDASATRLKDRDYFPRVLSAALIHGINDIVGLKLRRFADFARRMTGNETKAEVFDAITQPEKQMTQLLVNLHHLLHELTKDDTLQVVLARIENNLPVEFVERVPNDITLPPSLVTTDAARTLFHHSASNNRVIVIQDIGDHLQKNRKKRLYHPVGQPDEDKGSILCWPVFCETSGRVEYVLSIKSGVAKAITDDFRKLYKVPIGSFITRLLVEHNLKMIKRRAK